MPIRPNGQKLSIPEHRIMKTLVGGGHIAAQRTYPHPHRHTLINADWSLYRGKESPGDVMRLVGYGYIEGALAPEYGPDGMKYTATDAGRAGFAADVLPADDTQFVMFGAEAGGVRARTLGAMRGME